MSRTVTNVRRNGFSGLDRRRIPTPWLYALLIVGLVPFAIMGLRLAGLSGTGPLGLVETGNWLNQHFSLQWVGFEDRDVVLYILFLPLAALLIAISRLTLGIRVLGFRSILIAIGMQEIGVLPCLLLILLIAITVILIRPSMRRSGMPLYARVAVVLCVVAFTMLSGLLFGAWLDSATLWSMAFFPVVILAMLAESVADTVARDGLAMGLWRTAATILLAGLIALLHQLTPLRELVLSCPELLLIPTVMVIVVSECLDLRLFEGYRPLRKQQQTTVTKPQIALVRNRFPGAPPRRLATEVPRRYRQASLQELIDQLRSRDYDVQVLECDSTLPERLRGLAKTAFAPNGSGLCVLNYSGGAQGVGRLSQVPVICEVLGIPHTGPTSGAAVLWPDRMRQLDALRAAGLPVPAVLDFSDAEQWMKAGMGPVWVRPRFESDRGAARVENLKQLKAAIRRGHKRYGECMIEAVPAGVSITVVLQCPQDSSNPRALPVLARASGQRSFKPCVGLNENEQSVTVNYAARAAQTLGCRDTSRIDLHYSTGGAITITRVVAIEPLTARSAAAIAATHAGLSLADIAELSVQSALSSESVGVLPDAASTQEKTPRSTDFVRSHMPCSISVSSATI